MFSFAQVTVLGGLPSEDPDRVAPLADLLGGLGVEKLKVGLRYAASRPKYPSRCSAGSQSLGECCSISGLDSKSSMLLWM